MGKHDNIILKKKKKKLLYYFLSSQTIGKNESNQSDHQSWEN